MPEQSLPPPEIRQPNRLSLVYIPGLTGGGRSMTPVRGIPDLFTPSSITTPEARKVGERNTSEHYKNLAQEIITRTGDRDLVIMGHSFGGFEAFDVIDQLLKNPNFKSKNIQLALLGVPGVTERGIKGLGECTDRFIKVQKYVAQNEQHTAYPLPEKYYQANPSSQPTQVDVVSIDSPEDRTKRREAFKQTFLDSSLPKGMTRDAFFSRLDQIDMQIAGDMPATKTQKELLDERAKLLFNGIQSLFKGEAIDNKVHDSYRDMYKERVQDLSKSVKYQLNALLYFGRAGRDIIQGAAKRMKGLMDSAKQQGKTIDISFVLMERDEIIKQEDIVRLKQRLTEASIEEASVSFAFMEQAAHSSFGYEAKSLQDYVEILKKRAAGESVS